MNDPDSSHTETDDSSTLESALLGAAERLSPAERQVAEVVSRDPELIAFGTVAELAKRTGTSGPTVVRFAERLGFAGYGALQTQVRAELAQRLRPAHERLRTEVDEGGLIQRVLSAEVDNLHRTLGSLDEQTLVECVALLMDPTSRIFVVPSEQTFSPGRQLAHELMLLRDGVELVHGSDFGVATKLMAATTTDLVVVIDVRRHETWLMRASERLAERSIPRLSVTNSALSPLATGAALSLTVSASAVGPFDSHVGMLALFNAIVASIAASQREPVAQRIDALENEWSITETLEKES